MRGDPGDQGAARVARRHERPPRARDRQRDDELHPHADGGRRELRRRRSPRRSGSGYAEADPTDDVSGADAAAKMAILATVAFGSRVDARRRRLRGDRADHGRSTSRLRASSTWSCGSSARPRSSTGAVDVRVGPALVDRHHPLAAVEGAFNAVMLQGDAIREITLEGPGAGGTRDGVGGRGGHGQRDRNNGNRLPAERRVLAHAADAAPGRAAGAVLRQDRGRRPAGRARARGRAVRATRASRSPGCRSSVQNGQCGASTSSRHELRRRGRVDAALDAIAALPEVSRPPRGRFASSPSAAC